MRAKHPVRVDLSHHRPIPVGIEYPDDLRHARNRRRSVRGQWVIGNRRIKVARDGRSFVDLKPVVAQCRHMAKRMQRSARICAVRIKWVNVFEAMLTPLFPKNNPDDPSIDAVVISMQRQARRRCQAGTLSTRGTLNSTFSTAVSTNSCVTA